MSEDVDRGDQHDDKPRSVIEERIFQLTFELHKDGHTRRDIVHYLREVADTHEDFWEGKDSYDKSPAEKNVVLPGDYDE